MLRSRPDRRPSKRDDRRGLESTDVGLLTATTGRLLGKHPLGHVPKVSKHSPDVSIYHCVHHLTGNPSFEL